MLKVRVFGFKVSGKKPIVNKIETLVCPELKAMLNVSSKNMIRAHSDRHYHILFTQHHMFTLTYLKPMHFSTLASSPRRAHMPHS